MWHQTLPLYMQHLTASNFIVTSNQKGCRTSTNAVKITRKSMEAGNAPQMPIVYKRQILLSNTTFKLRHDKEKHCLWKLIRRDNQVKCQIGLWFLSSALPLINIYVCTKFNFNPFCTFQDMAQTGIHYEKKWLKGDVNIQCRIMILVHSTSSHCHLSIYQVWFKWQKQF